MKRSSSSSSYDQNPKKPKLQAQDSTPVEVEDHHSTTGFSNLDDNLLYEILKHADARSLATAACVSKLWKRTALDERLWELICTRHSPQLGCPTTQLRSVVLPLGGFRRLHSLYLRPLSTPTKPPPPPPNTNSRNNNKNMMSTARWGQDEVQLSLSLLSIRYFEKMNLPVNDK